MSTRRSNIKKRSRQKLRSKQRRQKADKLLTRGLITELARPISARGMLGAAIQQQERT